MTTTTTPDPVLLQRFYTTHNAGVPPWIFALVFVMMSVVILTLIVTRGEIRR